MNDDGDNNPFWSLLIKLFLKTPDISCKEVIFDQRDLIIAKKYTKRKINKFI